MSRAALILSLHPVRLHCRRLGAPVLLAAALLSGGCATGGVATDPLEPVNRKIYAFNSALDSAIIAPVARGYRDYVPYVLRYSFRSFLSNINDVWIGTNNLLQGKPLDALNDWTRVLLNSTFGFFGFSDPASELGYRKHSENFGQTLGVWGLPAGPYLVLPVLGPSSVRMASGLAVDYWVDPMSEIVTRDAPYWGISVADVIDLRSRLLDASTLIDSAALDEYGFVRDAYLQRTRSAVYDGDPPPLDDEDDDLPTYKD